MANTLTGLIQTIYEALNIVSRELVGFIPAVSRDSSAEQAAVNQTIRVPIAPTIATGNITPGQVPPDDGDDILDYVDMTISKSKYAPVRWAGEEQRSLESGGQLPDITRQRFAQAMRALVNEVEADLAAQYVAASRACGAVNAIPFATDLSNAAAALKILKDNGAPGEDLHMILDTTAGASMRNLALLTKANEAGGDDLLRRGVLLDVHGFAIRESAQVKTHTKGTGTNWQTNLPGGDLAKGATAIALDTGTNTMIAGDCVTFLNDTNIYVVGTTLNAGTVILNKPGLMQGLTDGIAATIGGDFVANLAFHRNAIQLITRAPAMPYGPDNKPMDDADDVITVTDPVSGLSFQVAMYRQYRRIKYEVGLAWGVQAIKPAHIVLLLGKP